MRLWRNRPIFRWWGEFAQNRRPPCHRRTTEADAHGGRLMLFYRGMTCENVTINGDKGTPITAYVAKPSGPGPFPGVVLVHHLPGWSEFYIETTRRLAHHGYLAICANLYERAGQGNPDDVAAKVRAVQSQRQGRHLRLLFWWPARLHLCLPEAGRRCLRRALGRPRGDGQGGAQCQDARRAGRNDEGPQLPAARHIRQRRPRAEPGTGEPARGRAQEARQDARVLPLRWCRPRHLLLAPATLPARAGNGCL